MGGTSAAVFDRVSDEFVPESFEARDAGRVDGFVDFDFGDEAARGFGGYTCSSEVDDQIPCRSLPGQYTG